MIIIRFFLEQILQRTSINNNIIINQIDVYILLKKYFPNNENISSEQILHNFPSYIKTIDWNEKQINFTFDEIMNLKKSNTDFFIVNKEYLPKNILTINNYKSNIRLLESQEGKKILEFNQDFRYIILNLNKGQNNPNLNVINQFNNKIIIIIIIILFKQPLKIILLKTIRLIIMIIIHLFGDQILQ